MPASDQTNDKRRFKRIPFSSEVTISQGKDAWLTDLKDIAFKGALTSTPADWPEITSPEPFTIDIALNEEHHIRFTATLAHREAETLGFHCENMDIDSATTLRRLVELNLGDQTLLEREFTMLISSE